MFNRVCTAIAFIVLLSSFSTFLAAEEPDSKPELSATLIVIGPGDPIYTYWGHIGIAIRESGSGEDLFYDFGNFSFYSDNFYGDFAMGRMLYRGMMTPTKVFLDYSMTEDRDIVLYPLNLDQKSVEKLNQALRNWMLPENREYLYEYFLNNCSTIIRDLLNDSTNGVLKQRTETIADRSFRHYARTGAHSSLAAELFLHYLLGPREDKPISLWDKMFLPQAVADIGMGFEYPDTNGTTRRLIEETVVLRRSTRPPVPDEPRRLWPIMLLAGLLISALGVAARNSSRRLATSYRVLVVLFIGLPGLVLGFLMGFTDHAATYGNINLWPSFPTILLSLIPLFRISGQKDMIRRRKESLIAWIWTVNLGGFVLAVILSLSGLRAQDAGAFWALYGPVTLSMSQAGLWLERKVFTRAG